eukprot:GEMP01029373.1.p1 GENE.GEMP01029373.1~~GEMP01029373.1.p1  ORF type:complete len:437 (+),score=93.70 GEMP01029373.1:38-1312(+)
MVRVWLRVEVLQPSYVISKEVPNVNELLTWVELICPKKQSKKSEFCLCRSETMGFSGEDDIAAHIRDKDEVHLELRKQTGESMNCRPITEMRRCPDALYCVEYAKAQTWGKKAEETIVEAEVEVDADADADVASVDSASKPAPEKTLNIKPAFRSTPGFFPRVPPSKPEEPKVVDWVALGQETEPWPIIHVRGRETLMSLVNHDVEEAMRFFTSGRVEPTLRDDEENSLLHWAALDGLEDMALKLIEYQASVNAWNVQGETPLLVACRVGHWGIAKLLIKAKAESDPYSEDDIVEGGTPLMWACRHGRADVVNSLCQNGAKVTLHDTNGTTPLHVSVAEGSTDITRILLQYGGHVDARRSDNVTPIVLAARSGSIEDLSILLDAFPRPTREDVQLEPFYFRIPASTQSRTSPKVFFSELDSQFA